ncbi:PREDICTED: uncharacterized protein LOC109482103 [Branchiostoma belcheri]|uniref:Uncharacterized protein LOC109482103 n=1 Tax=Branchiostoma belcheri TaxID=7741 RepID=A0A6P5A1W1_BRABE|nr:PREDICTED: uncharacterized protein LOC109482103 [Branchiostoma belcheri]XP_019640345.1 PREDICTED: uncharacterized protein LOC109482103 [Branchiostoma belcheri]
MGNAEDKEETETSTMSVAQSGHKDAPPNLEQQTVFSNGSKTDESSTMAAGTETEEVLLNTCKVMETDELEPSEGPPELQPYDLYQGPDFSETFDADAFDSIGLNSIVDDYDNDGRDTPELHLYDTATDEDFEGSNYSFNASNDGLMFNQDEITNELANEGQSVFSTIGSETEKQSTECPLVPEDHKLDIDEKEVASKEGAESATDKDRTEDSHVEKEDNQDNNIDTPVSKEGKSLSEKNEGQDEKKRETEKEGEKSKRDVDLDTFSAILASRSITHKVLADIATEWITQELKEVDQKSMPEVFQVPTSQSTWQLLSGERIYTRERQKKMMCRRSRRKRTGVSYKESDPLYNCSSRYEKTKRDKRFTANPWKKTVPAVDDDGKLNCRMCKFVCETYTAFHQHLLDHHTWKKCTKCSFLTQSQRKMNAHIKIMHTPKNQWPTVKMQKQCQLCGLEAGSPGQLQEHMLYFHKCYICGFITRNKGDLDKHMNTCHKGYPKFQSPQARNTTSVVQGSSNGQAGPIPAHTQNNLLQRPSLVQVPPGPSTVTQHLSFPQASGQPTRMQPISTVLGQPGAPVAVGVPGLRPGMITVPQQATTATNPMVVRLHNNANHAETFVRCTFCSYLFSTLNGAHAHMANVHWRQISALAQAGQKVILPKVILYTNNPPQRVQPKLKAPINKNTVRHLLNKDEHTRPSGNAVIAPSIPSHQIPQGTTTVINPSGQVPVPVLGSPATPVGNITVRHPGPAPQAITGIVRPPVVGAVNAIPVVRQGFQTVQATPSPIGITGTTIVRQQLQPNFDTTLSGGLTSIAPGTAVAPGTPVGPQQQLLVLKKEGDKFVWVTQSVPSVASPMPNQNKGLISAANITTANQTVASQGTANIVTNQSVTAPNAPDKKEIQASTSSNQADEEPKSESMPEDTTVTTPVTSTVITQSGTPLSITTAQNIAATPASTEQTIGTATTTQTNTDDHNVPSHSRTIAASSTVLPGVVSVSVSPVPVMPTHQVAVTGSGQLALVPQPRPPQPVMPSHQVGVTGNGQLALVPQTKPRQPPPKTVYFVNKAPQVAGMSAPQQVVKIQPGPQIVQRVGSPGLSVRGIQPGVVGSSSQPTTTIAPQTVLLMADGQRIVLPNNQKLITVPASTAPGGITPQPMSNPQTVNLAPPVEVSNSQFVMRNTNWRGPGMPNSGYTLRMPFKGQLQNIGPGQTLVANSVGGVIVPTQDVKADNSRPGRPALLSLAPKPEPKSDKDANKVHKSKKESDVKTATVSAKGTPQNRDKTKKASVKDPRKEKNFLNFLKKKKQKKLKTSHAEDAETILLRSFHSNPYLTSMELQRLKFKTYRSAADIRYWFHTMQRKCMKSLEQREPRVVICRCDTQK